jgi:hypothetical protein
LYFAGVKQKRTKIAFLGFLTVLILSLGSWMHPFYVGVSHVRINKNQTEAQIEVRLFTDDIQLALKDRGIDFNPKLSLSLTGNVGFYARIDNPNMIYYGTPPGQGIGQGNRPISQDDVYLVLIDQEYNPFDLNATIDWKVSPKTTLATSYNYQKTIFFNSFGYH